MNKSNKHRILNSKIRRMSEIISWRSGKDTSYPIRLLFVRLNVGTPLVPGRIEKANCKNLLQWIKKAALACGGNIGFVRLSYLFCGARGGVIGGFKGVVCCRRLTKRRLGDKVLFYDRET